MLDGRPKGFPSTRLESSRPTTWPSPIRDWQDDNFERQEQYSGGIGISIAGDKDRRHPAGWATTTRVLMMTARQEKDQDGSGVGGLSGRETAAEGQRATAAIGQSLWQRRSPCLSPPRTTTAGICPAISGATPILSVLRAPGWWICLF